MSRLDLLVAGAGPAGLATACWAAQRGLSVEVCDPRLASASGGQRLDKACGEGLMPGALRELAGLGVRPQEGRPFLGIRYLDAERTATGRFASGPGLGLRRTALHRLLWERAEALGVVLRPERVRRFAQTGDGVCAAGRRARWGIAADGLASPIRRELGLDLPVRSEARFGLRQHFACAPWSSWVEVYLAPEAEAYVTPVDDGLVGVAILFRGRGRFPELLARFPALVDRLAGASPASAVRGAGPFERRVRRRRAGRVLLVGDAAGYLDPLTGEGIRLGLAGARLLVDSLAQGRPGAWERRWRRLTLPYRVLTQGLLEVRRRRALARAMVPLLAAAPGLFTLGLEILDGSLGWGEVGQSPRPGPARLSPCAPL